jgi:hypothetical protein
MKIIPRKSIGMTLAELLVGAAIFSILMGAATSAGIMVFQGKTKIEYTNELYSETQFLMERLIREVRVNTIDYAEYFSRNLRNIDIAKGAYSEKAGLSSNEENYGENPGLYEMFFYYIPDSTLPKNDVSESNFSWKNEDRNRDVNLGIFNTGANSENDYAVEDYTLPSAEYFSSLGDTEEVEGLYLISGDGKTKTVFRHAFIEKTDTIDESGQIEMLKMILVKNASEKYEWVNHSDFPDKNDGKKGFISITPPNIVVSKFNFILSPFDDPHKAFAKPVSDDGVTVKIQPHVILQMSCKLAEKNARATLGQNNEFSLQSSAVSRIYHNVTFPRE